MSELEDARRLLWEAIAAHHRAASRHGDGFFKLWDADEDEALDAFEAAVRREAEGRQEDLKANCDLGDMCACGMRWAENCPVCSRPQHLAGRDCDNQHHDWEPPGSFRDAVTGAPAPPFAALPDITQEARCDALDDFSLARCDRPKGHEGQHDGPDPRGHVLSRYTWKEASQ